VPDAEFCWSCATGRGADPLTGDIDRTEHPGELASSALADIGELLRRLAESGGSWLDWLVESPIYAKVSDRIQKQQFELEIVEHLPHLREVCRRPRMQLEITVERVRAELARRVPPRAVEHLASHTEDWEELRVRSVRPRRVLSVLADDQLDIYENRVVARLLDHLLDYLNDRIEEVQQLRSLLQELVSYDDPASEATHWIRHRIYDLWGKATEAEQGERRAEQTLSFLENVRREVASLLDSALYQTIPRRAQVGSSLRTTNILVNDQHYRFVASLWQSWYQSRAARRVTARQLFDRRQGICTGFDAFAVLLVCRALHDLGFGSREDRGPARGGPRLELASDKESLGLTWSDDGTIRLDGPTFPLPLHFIPIAASLSAGSDLVRVRRRIAELSSSAPEAGEDEAVTGSRKGDTDPVEPSSFRVVLYPGAAHERDQLPADIARLLDTTGNDRLPSEDRVARLLPVSPLSIHSLERVARAIRWWLLDGLFRTYPPPPIPCPARIQHYGAPPVDWLSVEGAYRRVRVVRPPRPDERERWLDWLGAVRRQVLRDGNRALVSAEQLDDLERGVDQAVCALEPLTCCPLQLCAGASRFEPWQDREKGFTLFSASCEHAAWELRQCEACGERFPVLLPRSFRPREACRRPGWVDNLLGRDVLAVPCWGRQGTGDFICPRCGSCKNAGRSQMECLRCSGHSCAQ
jgi:hypothetical protein